MMDAFRICILVEQPYWAQTQPSGLGEALRVRGHHVALIDPQTKSSETEGDDWLADFDGVIARGQSWPLVHLLNSAERRGLAVINRGMAVSALHNKMNMAVALASAEVPSLRPYEGALADLRRQIPTATYLKLYGIGDEVWAVRQTSPLPGRNGKAPKIEVQLLTLELRTLSLRCGNLFGLELYGVDCLETDDGPVVIDINDFPDYDGVPNVDERLAEYCQRRIHYHRRQMHQKNWRAPVKPFTNGLAAYQPGLIGARTPDFITEQEGRSYLH